MQLNLELLMQAVLADPDAALECGWTPRQWENIGFTQLARRRIREVGELRVVLASLGATDLIASLRELSGDEKVELVNNPFVSY